MDSILILTICFSVVLILLLSAGISGLIWAVRQQKILVLTKFEMERIRQETTAEQKLQNQKSLALLESRSSLALSLMSETQNKVENQLKSFSETSKLLDKCIGLLSSKEPLAYQAIQTMDIATQPQIVSSEENERRMLNDDSGGVADLDDPRLAAELSGLI